jgi:FixJ family two-component response regulator
MRMPFTDRGVIGQPIWASENSAPVSVLLIDDDKEEAILTRSMLSKVKDVDYQLDWVPTYTDGLEWIARGEHDAFLIDQRLGGRTGIELVREAREAGSVAALVMLTGRRDRATDMAAMDAGATDFLMKGRTDAALMDRTLRYAIAQTTMMGALKRSHDQVAALEEIGQLLLDEGPTPTAVQRVVDLIVSRFYLNRIAIYVAEAERLDLVGQHGYEHLQRTLSLNDSSVARVLRARRPIFVPSLSQESGASGGAVATEMSIPLRVDGEVMGLMNVASFVASPIGETEYAAIRLVADRLTAALAVIRERRIATDRISRARLEQRRTDTGGIHDPETNAYRREMLEPLVHIATKLGASRRGGRLGLILVALDHATSDGLIELAATINLVFPDCTLIRFGSREFAVLLGHTEAPSALRKAGELTARARIAGLTVWCGYASLAPRMGAASLTTAAESALVDARRAATRAPG